LPRCFLSLSAANANGALRGENKHPVLARLSRSSSGLNRRNDLVVPQLRGDNHWHKADNMLGAAVNFAEVKWLEIGSD
jgi:hypothetical protein